MKKFLGAAIRSLSWIYAIITLLYGLVFISIDLTQTINYSTLADAQAGRVTQVMTMTPHILIGIMVISVLICYYISKNTKVNLINRIEYGFLVTIMSFFLFVATIIIAIIEKYTPLIIIMIPTFVLLVYGIYLLINRKK